MAHDPNAKALPETGLAQKETGLARKKMRDHRSASDNPAKTHNQMQGQPDATRIADELMGSYKKRVNDERARMEIGKGKRSGP